MSLLINETYVNPNQPLWEPFGGSGGGGTFSSLLVTPGNTNLQGLEVDGIANFRGGEVNVAGDLQVFNSGAGISLQNATGAGEGLRISTDATATNSYIETDGTLFLGQLGSAATANSAFTPSAPAANTDLLTIGGTIQPRKLNITLGGPFDSVGTSAIPVGQDNIVVSTTAVTGSSVIVFSRYGAPALGPGKGNAQGNLIYNPTDIVPGTSFKVYLTDTTGIVMAASNVDAQFVWWVVN